MIPHSRPTLGAEDAAAVLDVIESGQLAQGPRVAEFEKAMADRLCRRGGVATSSGTAALALALAALGVGPGDEVILPALACSALGQAVGFVGASAALADVGEDLCLAPEDAARRVSARTRAVAVVHPFGHPVDVRPFLEWGIPVVEDCAQGLGASVSSRPVGSMGTVAVCSFYATKLIATGEGGMVLADGEPILDAARSLRSTEAGHHLGFNFKLTDLAAALGLAQLARLDEFISRRREIAARYDHAFSGTELRTPISRTGAEPCFSRYVVRVPSADALIAGLARRGIEAKRPVVDPLVCRADPAAYPEAARALSECVSLPLYPSLTDGEVDRLVEAVDQALAEKGWNR